MKKKTDKVPNIGSVISTPPSTLPELDDLTFETVKNALNLYFDLKEGKEIDKNSLIEQLALAAHYAYEEVEYWYDIALRLEKQGKVNANIREHKAIYTKENEERAGKVKGGRKGRTHFRKEKLAILLFSKHSRKEVNPATGKRYTLSSIYDELGISLGTGKEWRKNYISSKGKTVYQQK